MNTISNSRDRIVRRVCHVIGGIIGLALGLLVVMWLGGCSGSQIGPSWDKGPDGTVASRNAAPNRVSLSKDGETWDSETAVPGKYIRMFDDNGSVVESLGPTSRVMLFPFFGKEAKIASDTDVTFSVAKATMPDGTKLEGFTFSTLASPVIKAQNEVWDRLGPVLIEQNAEGARAILSDNETLQSIVEVVGPGIIGVLETIAGGI